VKTEPPDRKEIQAKTEAMEFRVFKDRKVFPAL
jgi:hypothetical protein